tara:strand:+ start:1012 stop:1236 length:225 start_codon:yes stop_codon:yes gene_type:complete
MAKRKVKHKMPKKWEAVPLKGSFMITAILGLFISIYWVMPQSVPYGFSFIIVFVAMFIASLISMTKAPVVNRKY